MSKIETREPFILEEKTWEAITAVEGLRLSASARKQLLVMRERGLSHDEQRAELIRYYTGNKTQSQR